MVAEDTLKDNPQVVAAFEHAREKGRALHLLGLVSDGGVHSHEEHLYCLVRAAREFGLTRVFIHVYLDGRDTPPTSGIDYVAKLEQKLREYGVGKIATVSGRYYAMDRDKRWERQRKAFDAMVIGKAEGGTATTPSRPSAPATTPELRTNLYCPWSSSMSTSGPSASSATKTRCSTSTSAPTAPAR